MSKSSERFTIEWENYKKSNHNISVETIIRQLETQKHYYREQFSRFKSGQTKLDEKDLEIFSSLFQVRKEYLAGIDDYRTNEDLFIARKREYGLFSGLHQILVALGYADNHMQKNDYNPTFPENTIVFLESWKESFDKDNISVICDVNKDTYIPIPSQQYQQLLTDVVDYMNFKLNKLFSNASPVPTMITDDDSTLLHPSTSIKLKDGSSLTFDIKYIPNAQYDLDSLQKAFTITKHIPPHK